MKRISAALIAFLSIAVSGCGGSSASDDHENFTPELRIFDVIDSVGTDTAVSNEPLEFDADYGDGLYEIWWKVNSLEDYTVTLSINDRETIANSLVIHSEVCGAGRRCDQQGDWVCEYIPPDEYSNDFFTWCGGSADEKNISSIVNRTQKQVFLFLNICDTNSNYCEYDYYPVTLY